MQTSAKASRSLNVLEPFDPENRSGTVLCPTVYVGVLRSFLRKLNVHCA